METPSSQGRTIESLHSTLKTHFSNKVVKSGNASTFFAGVEDLYSQFEVANTTTSQITFEDMGSLLLNDMDQLIYALNKQGKNAYNEIEALKAMRGKAQAYIELLALF